MSKKTAAKNDSDGTGAAVSADLIADLVPGKEIEKAAGQLVTAAGRSAIRGIANILGAATAEFFAAKVERARAARLSIKTDAEIKRTTALTAARHRLEIKEIEHKGRVARAQRAIDRTIRDLEHQQENLEVIGHRSIELLEADPSLEPREFERNWLLRFSDYAQKVSESELQELWAQVLASAAVEGETRLSPAALATMALLDQATAKQFMSFIAAMRGIGELPIMYSPLIYRCLPIDLGMLTEYGLIEAIPVMNYQILDSFFVFPERIAATLFERASDEMSPRFEKYVPSSRGRQIIQATRIHKNSHVLSERDLEEILHATLLDKVAHFGLLKIFSSGGTIVITRVMKDDAELVGDPSVITHPVMRGAVSRLASNCFVKIDS